MLNILQGHDQLIREDYTVSSGVVVPEGAVVKLDSSLELVLTGATGAGEDFVWFAFNDANVTGSVNSAFETTGKITVIANTPFIAETDEYAAGSYVVGTKLTTENGKLAVAAVGDHVVGRSLSAGAVSPALLKFVAGPVTTVA